MYQYNISIYPYNVYILDGLPLDLPHENTGLMAIDMVYCGFIGMILG